MFKGPSPTNVLNTSKNLDILLPALKMVRAISFDDFSFDINLDKYRDDKYRLILANKLSDQYKNKYDIPVNVSLGDDIPCISLRIAASNESVFASARFGLTHFKTSKTLDLIITYYACIPKLNTPDAPKPLTCRGAETVKVDYFHDMKEVFNKLTSEICNNQIKESLSQPLEFRQQWRLDRPSFTYGPEILESINV